MKSNYLSLILTVSMALGLVFSMSCSTDSKSTNDETTEEVVIVEEAPEFEISLAQWSLHKTFFGDGLKDWGTFGRLLMESPDEVLQGERDPIEFPQMAAEYGINTIELVNTFYFGKVDDQEYWDTFKQKCDEAGVNVGLIMCDALGNIGDADEAARNATIEKHYKWVDIAKFLGAESIRVNAAGAGTAEEVAANAVLGLKKLGEYGAQQGINILVENHGGYSSDGQWLTGVMEAVGMDNVGTLPDFGNFCIERGEGYECVNEYDPYQGMRDLMPYAKGVSAKSRQFNKEGEEVNSDYLRIMKIVKESGFKGYVGIEYEGVELSEDEGIKATKALLDKTFAQL